MSISFIENPTQTDNTITPGAQPAEHLTERFRNVSPPNPDAPRTIFPSALKLTRLQEDKLCEHARRRFQELDDELGRSNTSLTSDGIPKFFESSVGYGSQRLRQQRKFFEKRSLYQLMIQNDYSWRPILMPGSIFAKSNLVVPLCRRIWKQMSARAHNYFFGTDPWLNIQGIGVEDEATAQAIQGLVDTKLKENHNTASFRRCIPVAFGMGEAVLKTVHVRNVDYYTAFESVAITPSGEIFADRSGEPITPNDSWVPAQNGGFVLERDGVTQHPNPEEITFEERLIEKEQTNYTGPSVRVVYYRDFMAPLNAPDLQSADCIVHVVPLSVNQLAAEYLQNPGANLAELANAIAAIQTFRGYDGAAKTGSDMRPENGDYQAPVNEGESQMEVGEFYMRFDANGDGYQENIMFVMDLQSGYPITYDYVANVDPTKTGQRPFRPVVPNPIDGRWYGIGTFEMFERHQEVIDLMINRRSVSQGEAGRVVGWRPENTAEGSIDPNLKLNWGGTYKLLPGKRWEDTLFITYLNDNKFDQLTEEMESQLQFAFNESGVQHANDANVAGMDSTKLATGIRNIEKTGQEMFGVYISELEGGINDNATAFTQTLYANMDDTESFIYFNGQIPVELTVQKRDVRNLRFNIQVLLSRYKDEQMLLSSREARLVLAEFDALPPDLQINRKPLFKQQLAALQVKNPDQYLIPRAEPVITGGGADPKMPPKESNVPAPNI